MERDQSASARARRDYLIAGAMALAAAVIGVVDQGACSSAPLWLVSVIVAVVAAACFRVVYVVSRREEGDAGPTVERMRRMALIWLILAAVLGVAVLRAPLAEFREGGAAGLRARDWAAAAAGLTIVVAAGVRAVRSFRGWVAKSAGD